MEREATIINAEKTDSGFSEKKQDLAVELQAGKWQPLARYKAYLKNRKKKKKKHIGMVK